MVEGWARALLRDVICGYLDPDLRSVADDILIAGDEPIDIYARDMREEGGPPGPEEHREPAPQPDAGGPEPEPAPEPQRFPDHPAVNAETRLPDGPGTAADPRSAAWAVAALPGPRTFREAPPPLEEERVEMAHDEATIADVPLPIEEQPTVDFPPPPPPPPPEPRFERVDDPPRDEPVQFQLETGVTASADWDDDAASYSAPI
jgi:hypothetical protein